MYGIRKKKKYLRVQDLYNDVQLWIRALHAAALKTSSMRSTRCSSTGSVKEHETEFLEYWARAVSLKQRACGSLCVSCHMSRASFAVPCYLRSAQCGEAAGTAQPLLQAMRTAGSPAQDHRPVRCCCGERQQQ
jgi:hypothetical protein